MRSNHRYCRVLLVVLALIAGVSGAFAEDVEKKFRIGLGVGGFNNLDEIESDSANALNLVDSQFLLVDRYVDPRDDSAIFGKLDIQSSPIASIYAQYAVTKIFIIEASLGYQQADVGDVEVQAEFAGAQRPDTQPFAFEFFRVPVGTIERIPLMVTGLARFRPRARFNPYIGGGVGYSFVGFEPTAEFNQLSLNMDRSQGGQARVSSSFGAVPDITGGGETVDLSGATVDIRDTFEWHLAGGAELSFGRRWAIFLDVRWTFASRGVSINFNDSSYLGIPVPNFTDFQINGLGNQTYGPVRILTGGLVDGGSLVTVPREDQPVDTDCAAFPLRCREVFDSDAKDGVPDPGFYYSQGGTLDYGGLGWQIGFRYTF